MLVWGLMEVWEGTYTRLNSDNRPSRQRTSHPQIPKHWVYIFVIRMTTRVMRIHAQIMTQAVREERNARSVLQDIFFAALKNAEFEQTVDGEFMRC